MIEQLPRLLVGPPTSCGHSSNAHHDLQQHKFSIKTKNTVLHNSGKMKMEKQREIVFSL
jgi:hypothetical protein